MGLVKRVNGINTELLEEVFGNIGLVKCDPVKIELKANPNHYSKTTPRRVPLSLSPKAEAELKHMLAIGIIKEVTGPTDC